MISTSVFSVGCEGPPFLPLLPECPDFTLYFFVFTGVNAVGCDFPYGSAEPGQLLTSVDSTAAPSDSPFWCRGRISHQLGLMSLPRGKCASSASGPSPSAPSLGGSFLRRLWNRVRLCKVDIRVVIHVNLPLSLNA